MSTTNDTKLALRAEGAREWLFHVINGPNMNQLGKRDPGIFGSITSLDALVEELVSFGRVIGVKIAHFHSNHEGALLDYIHENSETADAFVINPAGIWTYGEATRDALADSGTPWAEVHFANVAALPGESVFSHAALGEVMGLRQYGYHAAILALALALDDQSFLGSQSDT